VPVQKVLVFGLVLFSVVAVGDYYGHDMAMDSKRDWRGAAQLIDASAAPGAVVLFNTGYCDSNVTTDLQCTFSWYSQRHDLRLVPFFDSGPVDPGNVARLDSIVANVTDVWLVYGFVTDTSHLIPTHLMDLGFQPAGASNLKRLDVRYFTRAALPSSTM
jgi:hypothetical protein